MPFCPACCGSRCARGNQAAQILPLQERKMTDERGGILVSSLPVGEHKCILLVRKLYLLWTGSPQWVSLAKWAVLLVWSDSKGHLQVGWGAEEGVRRLICLLWVTQIIGRRTKFFPPVYCSMKVFEQIFLWNAFVSSKKWQILLKRI